MTVPRDIRRLAAAIVSLLALLVIGLSLISSYVAEERERDLLQWESRLGLVADARSDAVARLLAGYRRDLDELASNASLRFYLWQVTRSGAVARCSGAAIPTLAGDPSPTPSPPSPMRA